MGSEAVATHLMFFIVTTSIAAGAAGILATTVLAFGQGVADRAERIEAMLGTEVTIINDPNKVPVNPIILYVKNIGGRVLEPATLTVLVDGRLVNATATLQNGAPRWAPGDVVRLDIPTSELTLSPGDHTVLVHTDAGTSDTFRFRST